MLVQFFTDTIYDADNNVTHAAGFSVIDDDKNAPVPENIVCPNQVVKNTFENEWGRHIPQEFAMGVDKHHMDHMHHF